VSTPTIIIEPAYQCYVFLKLNINTRKLKAIYWDFDRREDRSGSASRQRSTSRRIGDDIPSRQSGAETKSSHSSGGVGPSRRSGTDNASRRPDYDGASLDLDDEV